MANFQKSPKDANIRLDSAGQRLILMLEETVKIDLFGGGPRGEDLVVDTSDTSVASVSQTPVARNGHLITYSVTGLKSGATKLEARLFNQSPRDYQAQRMLWNSMPVWASVQISVMGEEYRQAGGAWGNLIYGSTNPRWKHVQWTNMATAGCGPTSLSIVLDYLDRLNSPDKDLQVCLRGIDPLDTMKYTSQYGRAADDKNQPSGTSGTIMMDNISKYWPDYEAEKVSDLNHAAALLRANNPLVFLCRNCTTYKLVNGQKKSTTFPGHFMVLLGVENDNKTFWISDPSHAQTTYISSSELQGSDIWRVYKKTDETAAQNPLTLFPNQSTVSP